jgi:HK97 family phage portal protein
VASSYGGGSGSAYFGLSGELSIPAVAAAIRLIAESLGSAVLRVFTGDAENKQPLLDSSQAALFQDAAEDTTSFNLWEDVATSIEVTGNAFIWKVRVAGRVEELFAFPADVCRVFRAKVGGQKRIEARIDGKTTDITADVVHIRGWSPMQSPSGASPVELHRRSLIGMVALDDFRGRYFDSDASPNLVLVHPGNLQRSQRDELRESWKARHAGPRGEKTAILWGGMEVKQLSSTLRDMQAAEIAELDVKDVARMFRIYPASLLTMEHQTRVPEAELVGDTFYRLSLMPRLRRIERALSSDREIFPDRKVYARFDVGEITRGNITTVANKVHMLKQVGILTANEGRAEIGLSPSDDPTADELQVTPVGGAPNEPASLPSADDANSGDAGDTFDAATPA